MIDPSPPSPPSPLAAPAFSRGLAAAFTLLCLAGLAASVELTRVHLGVHTDPAFLPACAVSEGVNCATVALSPFSVVAGLPVAIWGILGYAVMGGLAASALGHRAARADAALGLVLPLAAFSAAVSGVLAFVSATRIRALCVYCAASQAITFLLLALAVVAWRRSRLPLGAVVAAAARTLVRWTGGLAILGGGTAAVGALLWLVPPYWTSPAQHEPPPAGSGTDEAGLRWIGARDPTLTIVEFSDYECPHCRAAHRVMRSFVARHPEVRLVHRHYPLDVACNPSVPRPFHGSACRFAEAAECAGLQGRFWEMNDELFLVQERLPPQDVDVLALARHLGLELDAFRRCLAAGATTGRIAADVAEAHSRGLRGTPSYVVRERVHLGLVAEAELEALLRRVP